MGQSFLLILKARTRLVVISGTISLLAMTNDCVPMNVLQVRSPIHRSIKIRSIQCPSPLDTTLLSTIVKINNWLLNLKDLDKLPTISTSAQTDRVLHQYNWYHTVIRLCNIMLLGFSSHWRILESMSNISNTSNQFQNH